MKQTIFIAVISLVVWIGAYLYFPVSIFDPVLLGSTITTIQGSDTLSASRAVINTNFSNLNTDKLQSGDTAAALTITALTSPAASTTLFSCDSSAQNGCAVHHLYAYNNVSTSTLPNATTTRLIVGGFLEAVGTAIQTISSSASVALSRTGQIAIDFTSDLLMYRSDDGTTRVVETAIDGCFPVASTSLSHFPSSKPYGSSGTTTYAFDFKQKRTLSEFYCKSDRNSLLVEIGDGSASTTHQYCSPGGYTQTSFANNTFNSRERMFFSIGSATATPNTVTICPYLTITAD